MDKETTTLDNIEQLIKDVKFFEKLTRNMSADDRKLCERFRIFVIKRIAFLEMEVLEKDIIQSKLLEKIKIANMFLNHNNGYFDISLREILKTDIKNI